MYMSYTMTAFGTLLGRFSPNLDKCWLKFSVKDYSRVPNKRPWTAINFGGIFLQKTFIFT